jgi:hypothetical protein
MKKEILKLNDKICQKTDKYEQENEKQLKELHKRC